MACAGKGYPLRIIGGGSLEEELVSVAGPHAKKFIFADWYHDPSTFVFDFTW